MFNEILPRSPHWLHGESMVADFQHYTVHFQISKRLIIDEVMSHSFRSHFLVEISYKVYKISFR
jgi:hypothetical protein